MKFDSNTRKSKFRHRFGQQVKLPYAWFISKVNVQTVLLGWIKGGLVGFGPMLTWLHTGYDIRGSELWNFFGGGGCFQTPLRGNSSEVLIYDRISNPFFSKINYPPQFWFVNYLVHRFSRTALAQISYDGCLSWRRTTHNTIKLSYKEKRQRFTKSDLHIRF